MANSMEMYPLYLNMVEKLNLTHLIKDEDNVSHIHTILKENFPWPPDMRFTSANVISITVYCVQLIVGLCANIWSLIYLVKERMVLHSNNRMVLLLIHLTCADLCVILIGIPLEIAWTATVSWWADWITCKVMVFLRIFGYFISGNILMAISIDRYSATVFPISHRSSSHQTRMLLFLAWFMAGICSIPQSIVFKLKSHPIIHSYRQCINTITFTDKDKELAYFLYFFTLSWLLPIFVMIFCYVSIIVTIFKRKDYRQPNVQTSKIKNISRSLQVSLIGKAKMKTIKVTGVLIIGFIVTWLPYQVNCLWYYFNRTLFDQLDPWFQKLLWNFASMANVINPFLYAMFDYGPDLVGCRKYVSNNEGEDMNNESDNKKGDCILLENKKILKTKSFNIIAVNTNTPKSNNHSI